MNEENEKYADDALIVENGTQPKEIRDFVERRATNPHIYDDKVVWDFNNHNVDEETLRDQISDFFYDEFVIPFQAPGGWLYIVMLLPPRIRQAEVLAYDQNREQYNPYPNFLRHSEEDDNARTREYIEERL